MNSNVSLKKSFANAKRKLCLMGKLLKSNEAQVSFAVQNAYDNLLAECAQVSYFLKNFYDIFKLKQAYEKVVSIFGKMDVFNSKLFEISRDIDNFGGLTFFEANNFNMLSKLFALSNLKTDENWRVSLIEINKFVSIFSVPWFDSCVAYSKIICNKGLFCGFSAVEVLQKVYEIHDYYSIPESDVIDIAISLMKFSGYKASELLWFQTDKIANIFENKTKYREDVFLKEPHRKMFRYGKQIADIKFHQKLLLESVTIEKLNESTERFFLENIIENNTIPHFVNMRDKNISTITTPSTIAMVCMFDAIRFLKNKIDGNTFKRNVGKSLKSIGIAKKHDGVLCSFLSCENLEREISSVNHVSSEENAVLVYVLLIIKNIATKFEFFEMQTEIENAISEININVFSDKETCKIEELGLKKLLNILCGKEFLFDICYEKDLQTALLTKFFVGDCFDFKITIREEDLQNLNFVSKLLYAFYFDDFSMLDAAMNNLCNWGVCENAKINDLNFLSFSQGVVFMVLNYNLLVPYIKLECANNDKNSNFSKLFLKLPKCVYYSSMVFTNALTSKPKEVLAKNKLELNFLMYESSGIYVDCYGNITLCFENSEKCNLIFKFDDMILSKNLLPFNVTLTNENILIQYLNDGDMFAIEIYKVLNRNSFCARIKTVSRKKLEVKLQVLTKESNLTKFFDMNEACEKKNCRFENYILNEDKLPLFSPLPYHAVESVVDCQKEYIIVFETEGFCREAVYNELLVKEVGRNIFDEANVQGANFLKFLIRKDYQVEFANEYMGSSLPLNYSKDKEIRVCFDKDILLNSFDTFPIRKVIELCNVFFKNIVFLSNISEIKGDNNSKNMFFVSHNMFHNNFYDMFENLKNASEDDCFILYGLFDDNASFGKNDMITRKSAKKGVVASTGLTFKVDEMPFEYVPFQIGKMPLQLNAFPQGLSRIGAAIFNVSTGISFFLNERSMGAKATFSNNKYELSLHYENNYFSFCVENNNNVLMSSVNIQSYEIEDVLFKVFFIVEKELSKNCLFNICEFQTFIENSKCFPNADVFIFDCNVKATESGNAILTFANKQNDGLGGCKKEGPTKNIAKKKTIKADINTISIKTKNKAFNSFWDNFVAPQICDIGDMVASLKTCKNVKVLRSYLLFRNCIFYDEKKAFEIVEIFKNELIKNKSEDNYLMALFYTLMANELYFCFFENDGMKQKVLTLFTNENILLMKKYITNDYKKDKQCILQMSALNLMLRNEMFSPYKLELVKKKKMLNDVFEQKEKATLFEAILFRIFLDTSKFDYMILQSQTCKFSLTLEMVKCFALSKLNKKQYVEQIIDNFCVLPNSCLSSYGEMRLLVFIELVLSSVFKIKRKNNSLAVDKAPLALAMVNESKLVYKLANNKYVALTYKLSDETTLKHKNGMELFHFCILFKNKSNNILLKYKDVL